MEWEKMEKEQPRVENCCKNILGLEGFTTLFFCVLKNFYNNSLNLKLFFYFLTV